MSLFVMTIPSGVVIDPSVVALSPAMVDRLGRCGECCEIWRSRRSEQCSRMRNAETRRGLAYCLVCR